MPDLLDRLNSSLTGRYWLEEEVGQGGMATVFRARDQKHGRNVAIKVLHPDLAASVGHERFLREIEILAGLNHPNILGLIDSGEADGLLYYVMPYVEGESLRDRLVREGQLPIEDAVHITREVADALGFAHEQGFVHRDVKPGNIMFVAGHAVVTDFGIARALSEAGGDQLTQTGLSVGTPHYMSPEQATGETEIDPRSDVYSLGCVLYEMVGGEPPYTGPTSHAILARHSQAEIPSVEIIRPQTPPHVQRVIEKSLSKTRADRFRTAGHLRDALTGELEVPARRRPRKQGRSRERVALIAVSVLVLAAVAWSATGLLSSGEDVAPVAGAASVAILPFFQVGAELDSTLMTGSAVARYLAQQFDVGRYDAVGQATVERQVAEQCNPQSLERICGGKIANLLGARYFVYGTVTWIAGDSVSLVVTPVDYTDERSFRPIIVEGSLAEAMPLLDSIGVELWAQLAAEGETAVRLARKSTDNPLALAAFFEGERHFQDPNSGDGGYSKAHEHFQRAVEIDSTFSLAWHCLANIYHWNGRTNAAIDAAERARTYAARLPDRDQRMIQAFMPHMAGQVAEAEAVYREILSEDPTNVEAQFALGQLYWAYNWRQGRSIIESEGPLRRVVELAPAHSVAAAYLQFPLAAQGKLDAMDSIASSYPHQGHLIGIQLLRALEADDSAAVQAALDFHRDSVSDGTGGSTSGLLNMYWQATSPRLDVSVSLELPSSDPAYLAGRGHSPDEIDRYRHDALLYLAYLDADQGKWNSARAYMMAADLIPYSSALGDWGLLVTLPFNDPEAVDVEWLRSRILSYQRPDSIPRGKRSRSNTFYRRVSPLANSYLLGLLAAREGDLEAAREHARILEQGDSPIFAPSLSRDLAQGLRADVLYREGQFEEALAALDQAEWRVSYMDAWASPFIGGIREPLLRARILQALGRFEEALNFYENASFTGTLSHSYLHRGEVYEAMGDTAQAIWHYETFAEIWKDADAELQVKRTEVLRHVGELKGEPLETQVSDGL